MMTKELPKGWVETEFESICKAIRGITFPASKKQFEKTSDNICCLRTTNVQSEIDWDDIYFVDKSYVKRDEQEIQVDDILMSMANSYELVGKVSLVKSLEQNATFGAFLSAIRPLGKVNSRFLYYQIKTDKIQEELRRGSSQTVNIANISLKKLSALKFLLPPLNEQKRIVAKLDQLLARVDSAHARLATAAKTIKRFRQAVLNAAVTGGLTDDWRKNKETSPVSWQRQKLEKCAEMRLGKMLDKNKNKGIMVRYLRNTNIRWFSFDLSDLKELQIDETERKALSVENGDVFICEGGEPGRSAVWRHGSNDLTFQKALHRVRLDKKVLPDWLVFNLFIDGKTKKLDKYFTGTTIKHLTGKSLKQYNLLLPPLEEQKEIVKRVEALFALADAMEAKLNAAQTRTDNLTASLLAKAFRGELVPQDPNDQPAAELLKEIQASKSNKKPKQTQSGH
jgi:type I restriction enzyme S subunit